MSFGNSLENSLLLLLFNATAIANIADNADTSPLTSLYVSLHTGDPGEAGDQTTNEATYGSYARVAVARTSGGWTITNNQVENTDVISFPQATSGSENITHFAVGTASNGAGSIIMYGALTSSLAVSTGITPSFAAGALTATLD